MKALAGLQGIDLDKGKRVTTDTPNADGQEYMFKDPEEYKNMTQEEREAETRKMMGYHKAWVQKKGTL